MDQDIADAIESIRKRNPLKDPTTLSHKNSGEAASKLLYKEISGCFGDGAAIDILDFGTATGRVAVPLARLLPASRVLGVDVDQDAITYLRHVAPPNVSAAVSGYNPPLADIPNDAFDVIFSLSVWSHFPEDLGLQWLAELRRIARPGALILISTGGAATLEVWKKNSEPWKGLSADDLTERKFIYLAFRGIEQAHEKFPGIAGQGSWGNAAIHPEYIKETWSQFFDVKEVREAGFSGSQDLVIMRKR